MATTYAYSQTTGTTTVEYNMSADFTTGFSVGARFDITGRVRDTAHPVTRVEARLYTNASGTGGTSYRTGGFIPLKNNKNVWIPFRCNMSGGGATFPSATQALKVYLNFAVTVSLTASSTQENILTTPDAQSGWLFNWHTSAHIADGSGIVRCDGNGIQRPDGNRLRFENFQVLTHSGSTLNKITFQVMQSGATSGNTYTVPSNSVTVSKLTSSRYTESTPAFFPSTLSISSAYSYTVLISFTDAYETTQQTLSIPRGAPILDFSLANKGGLAVGQYSSSTDTEPRFEVNYPAYLAGGLVLTPGETRDTKSGQLMMTGIRFGRAQASRSIAAGSGLNDTISFSPPFSTTNYVVLVSTQNGNRCTTRVGTQTTSSFNVRFDNLWSTAYRPVVHWLAIEGSTEDSGDITDTGDSGGTTPTYPENILRGTGTLKTPVTDRNGTYTNGTWYKSGGGIGNASISIISVTSGVDSGISQAFSIKNTTANFDLGQYPVPVTSGSAYTASLWAKVPSGTAKLEVYLFDRTASKSMTFIDSNVTSTSWQHFHGTVTFTGDGANSSMLFGISSGTAVDLCGFKLEKGTNSNPTWTANPND